MEAFVYDRIRYWTFIRERSNRISQNKTIDCIFCSTGINYLVQSCINSQVKSAWYSCHLCVCEATAQRCLRLASQTCRGRWQRVIYSLKFRQCCTRACLKNHSRHLHAPLCGIFVPNSLNAAHCAAFIWPKSPTKRNAHLAESIFQTRSRRIVLHLLKNAYFSIIFG